MIAAAVLRLGRFTRFVPHSVMIGFLTGVAVNIVLGQLPDLVGSDVSGDIALAKAWHLLLDLRQHRPRLAGRRSVGHRHPGGPRPHPPGGLLVAHRAGHPHRCGDRSGRRHCPARPRRRARSPRPAAARASPAERALHRPRLGRARRRGARPRPGSRGQRVGAQPGRVEAEPNRDFLAQGVGNVLPASSADSPSAARSARRRSASRRVPVAAGRRSSPASGWRSSCSPSPASSAHVAMPTLAAC